MPAAPAKDVVTPGSGPGRKSGLFVFPYPADNEACLRAVQLYRDLPADQRTLSGVTLQAVVEAIRADTVSP